MRALCIRSTLSTQSTMSTTSTVHPIHITARVVVIRGPILLFLFFLLQIRNAFLHPFRRGRAFQKMIEEFLYAPRVVLLINSSPQPMLLAVVHEAT